MLVSLTVGKVDAGVAVLLTEDKRLIEFPSILLPPDIATGSIVDVNVSRNLKAEVEANNAFDELQSSILSTFGSHSPQTPILRCRNATQTSVVLEWDPISLATAKLRSLSLYRNGAKAGVIPRPMEMTSTKISGLAVDTEYTFMLILRTSAGTYTSEKLTVKTHKMTDLSGITITPGVMAPELRESLENTIKSVGAKLIEQVRIDTTHFVCTEGRGPGFEKAREMNIPVVLPDWLIGCQREGRLVGVRSYYLDANPKDRVIGSTPSLVTQPSQQSIPLRQQTPEQTETPTTNVIPPTPERRRQESDDEKEHDDQEKLAGSAPSKGEAEAESVSSPEEAQSASDGDEEVDDEGDGDETISGATNGANGETEVETPDVADHAEATASDASNEEGKEGKLDDVDL